MHFIKMGNGGERTTVWQCRAKVSTNLPTPCFSNVFLLNSRPLGVARLRRKLGPRMSLSMNEVERPDDLPCADQAPKHLVLTDCNRV